MCRKLTSVNPPKSEAEKCAIDHILEAQKKGEINEDNVLYIVENINVAGTEAAAFRESIFRVSHFA
jgi:trans-cinnamate 4-monooxygenase